MEHIKPDQEEENKTEQKPLFKKKKWIMLTFVFICTVVGGSGFYIYQNAKTRSSEDERKRPDWGQNDSSGYITATGTTVVGVEAEEFEIDFLEDTELYVEAVYLSAGDEVKAGTQYIKFSEDSISDARKELEDAALNASIAYRTNVISTKESKLKAEYTYKQTILSGEQAQGVYDDKIAELTQNLEEAKNDYEEAQSELEELQKNLSGGYEEEFEVAAKKKAYEDTRDLYHDIMKKYDLTEEDLTSTTTEQTSSAAAPGKQTQQDSDLKWQKSAITLVKEEYEECEEEYEQAQSDLEDALANYELKLKKAQNSVDKALAVYEAAQLAYDKESLSAKTTLETTLAKAKTAKTDYETELASLEEELAKLADEEETATENLALFEKTIGDGYLYTAGSGTILRIMAEEGSTLDGGRVVLAYQDSSKMTVSVSVSQEYISQLTVGESAYVSIDEQGAFNGKIASINPVSSSDSRTAVSYTVEILLEGDISNLKANLTANVVFGTTMEEMQAFEERNKPGTQKQQGMTEDNMRPDMSGGRKNEQEHNE